MKNTKNHVHRPADESAKNCFWCNRRQRRRFIVDGPLTSSEVNFNEYEVAQPKRSNRRIWKYIGLGWLVNPPDYSLLDGWFTIDEDGRCDCEGNKKWHSEKKVARKFGLSAIIIIFFKGFFFEDFTFNYQKRKSKPTFDN